MSRKALEDFLASEVAKFNSWVTTDKRSPQARFLRGAENHVIRIMRSGNRVGKTTVGVVDVVADCLGYHPWSKNRPPNHWWVSGLDWEFGIGQVIWPKMKPYIPMSKVRSIAWMRKSEPEIPISILFRNGSQIDFKSSDSGRRKYQGADLDGLWLDEEHPPDVVEEARTRLLDRDGYLNVTLTPLMRMRWVQDLEKDQDTLVIRTSMRDAADAGILRKDVVEKFARGLPEKQRRVRVNGEFVALEGQVYPELTEGQNSCRIVGDSVEWQGERVCAWPIPESYKRWWSADWGYVNPTVVHVAAEIPGINRLVFYRCYYAAGIRGSQWGKLLSERAPERLATGLICDHDAQVRAEIEAGGTPEDPWAPVSTVAADKDIDRGLEAVQRCSETSLADGMPQLLFLVDEDHNDDKLGRCDCHKVFWEADMYHYPEVKANRADPKDRPVKKDDHAMDALRYLVIEWERSRKGPSMPDEIIEPEDQEASDFWDDGYTLDLDGDIL